MESLSWWCTTLLLQLAVFINSVSSSAEYMVSKPEAIIIPYNYETKLTCEMNIEPDNFEWKFYPSNDPYNPKSNISLTNSQFHLLSSSEFAIQRKKSALTIQGREKSVGEYQCLAYYGAYVVASIPWKITLAIMKDFPSQKSTEVYVAPGNTVTWYCQPPESNPEAYIDYYKDDSNDSLLNKTKNNILVLSNVGASDSGRYTCKATNAGSIPKVLNSKAALHLNVARSAKQSPPSFVQPPKKNYEVEKGHDAFLECSAVGNPVPKVVWYKKNGQLPSDRIEMVAGGLVIKNVIASDNGVYVCNYTNVLGTVSQPITLSYKELPSVDCYTNNTDIKEGEALDLQCEVKGVPEPEISWFLNGFSVRNDKSIEPIGNKIYFQPVAKKHAGNLQCFARNSVGTVYSSIYIRVFPLTMSIEVPTAAPPTTHPRHKGNGKKHQKQNKHSIMVPPSKPTISRLNDESVVVRWSVPNNSGLPIQFFKVQYKDLGDVNETNHNRRGSRWMTDNIDIPPNIKDYDVHNLKANHYYRFRIAAVYSNNDNKLSKNSDKFLLRSLDFDMHNPLPVPIIINTETVNDTAVKIYWKYKAVPNVTIDGFYISYVSASTAADYMKTTVDGENTRSFIITHLQSNTIYDVKLQSFTSKYASEFSSIMKARTAPSPTMVSSTTTPSSHNPPVGEELGGVSRLYIIIAVAVLVLSLLSGGVVLLFCCRKWQRSKNGDNRDKPVVDDHHIQVDGNEYVVGPKTHQRPNGCTISANRMTITANPLADADNKNQNIMEMSCLTAQNNNCSSSVMQQQPQQQPSASGGSESQNNCTTPNGGTAKDKNKVKNRHKKPLTVENPTSRENYV